MNKLCKKLIAAIDNDDLPLAKKLINIDRKSDELLSIYGNGLRYEEVDYKAIRKLLEDGANPNYKSSSILFTALNKCDLKLMELLLIFGAKLKPITAKGYFGGIPRIHRYDLMRMVESNKNAVKLLTLYDAQTRVVEQYETDRGDADEEVIYEYKPPDKEMEEWITVPPLQALAYKTIRINKLDTTGYPSGLLTYTFDLETREN